VPQSETRAAQARVRNHNAHHACKHRNLLTKVTHAPIFTHTID
jgi:hypothetical protein